MKDDLPYILVLFSLFIVSYNRGFFTFTSFILLLSIIIILIYLYLRPIKLLKTDLISKVKILFLTSFILFLYNSSGIYQSKVLPSVMINILSLILFPFVLVFFKTIHGRFIKSYLFPLFILFALVLRILMISASPNPRIDVYTLLKESPLKLMAGQNPYQAVYSPVYANTITDNLTYWPYSFLLQIPWVILFNDPRVFLLISDILAAILLYMIGRKTSFAALFTLIYLFRPNSLFIIEQSWLTPLLSLLTYLIFFSLIKNKFWLTGIASAIISGVQPIFLVFLPLTFPLWKKKADLPVVFLLFFVPVVSFFLFWNSVVFIEKTILLHFKPIEEIKNVPVYLSLSLNTFYYFLRRKDIPLYINIVILISTTSILYFKKLAGGKNGIKYTTQTALHLSVIFIYIFYFFFKQSFINHYYFAGSLLLLWITYLSLSFKEKS